jgi:phosphoglycerate dehydrogenase-like enzyme
LSAFRIGLTRDFLDANGESVFGDIGLGLLTDAPGVTHEFLADYLDEVTPEQIAGFDGIISLRPRYTTRTFEGSDGRLAILARFGVGYDNVDVEALTHHDVMLAITPDGVRRPVASSIVLFVLALAHQLPAKERSLRTVGWHGPSTIIGVGLAGRTLGSIGIGNIGAEMFRLIKPFGMRFLAHDPYANPAVAAELGVELVSLDELLRQSDFVCVNCPLSPATRGLVGERELGLMKSTAFLINTARGPIVVQPALYQALKERRIRGAALDVFEQEPIAPDDPLLSLDNVIMTPHAICFTDEVALGNGQSAIRAMLSVARGEVPPHIVNRDVLTRPGTQAKLARYATSGAVHVEEGRRA